MPEPEMPCGEQDIEIAPPGTPVLDLTGQAIGSIADAPPRTGCVAIYKGLFYPRLIYIPHVHIVSIDSYGVRLSLRKIDLCQEYIANHLSTVTLPA